MQFKDKSLAGWDLKVYSEIMMGMLAMWRRQLGWIFGRYKLVLIGFAFTLMIWTLVRGPSDVEDGLNPQPLKSEPRKVKDIPDFDYKYDNDKNVEYSDQGSRGDLNVKHSVHNYIQSHQDQIKAVNANIKDNLLISNNLEDEVPSEDLSKSIDSVRLKEKPTRSQKNSLNGVNIQIDDSGA